MGLLSDEEIAGRLEGTEWRREGDALVRDARFADFAAAIAFVNRLASAAEEADHHPDVHVHGYNRATVRLTTHSAGGITERDVDLARKLDALM